MEVTNPTLKGKPLLEIITTTKSYKVTKQLERRISETDTITAKNLYRSTYQRNK